MIETAGNAFTGSRVEPSCKTDGVGDVGFDVAKEQCDLKASSQAMA
jgi:hypothetical protein